MLTLPTATDDGYYLPAEIFEYTPVPRCDFCARQLTPVASSGEYRWGRCLACGHEQLADSPTMFTRPR